VPDQVGHDGQAVAFFCPPYKCLRIASTFYLVKMISDLRIENQKLIVQSFA